MLDVSSTSAVVIVAIGVIVGVVFTVLEIRNLTKQRQTNLVIRLYSTVDSQEFQKAYCQNLIAEFKDFDDFLEKYGPRTNIEVWSSWNSVPAFFEGVVFLCIENLLTLVWLTTSLAHQSFMHGKK